MRDDATGGAGEIDPEVWERLKRLFHDAAERPPEERSAFLAMACAGDPMLQREVESLLASDVAASGFLDVPAAASLADAFPDTRPVVPALTVGRSLGSYDIVGFLGAGGMSEVYLARDRRLGRDVAIKVVGRRDADARGRGRLLREAQHASRLNHPHICTVHEVNEDDGVPFIVMERIEGAGLNRLLRTAPIALEDLLRLGIQIAGALEHAHARGIVHRDLKSANVMVTPDGRAKVLDFGLARRLSARSADTHSAVLESSTLAGTVSHMAPEVLLGRAAGVQADVWAFGVLLYEMASGELPFAGRTSFETAAAVISSPAAPLPAHVPPFLAAVVERCLVKNPAKRCRRISDVREALESIQLGSPPRGVLRTPRPRRRRLALVAAAAVAGAALTIGFSGGPADERSDARTVAVLPFTPGAGGSPDYFLDGVTEGLIADLGAMESIRVTARPSVMRYRTARGAPADIARELGADRLVEATLSRSQGRIRVSARLMDASGDVLWTRDFDRSVRDVLALQADMADGIASAMGVDVLADRRRRTSVRAVDPAVHEAFLKGRYHWTLRTEVSLRQAIDHFNAAIGLDPTYAPAHAALADCFNQFGTLMVGTASPREMRPRARAAATRALQIDPDLADAHATLGYIDHYDLQWEAAERGFRRAIDLNPSHALAHVWYANLLASRRRFGEAVPEVLLARDLDPLSVVVNTNVGWTLLLAGRGEEAVAHLRSTLLLDPGYGQARSRLGQAYASMGRFDAAIAESEPAREAGTLTPSGLAGLAQLYAAVGRTAEARRILDELLALARRQYVPPGAIGNVYVALGDHDTGLEWLERSFEERGNNIAYLAVDFHLDPLRRNPRFVALLKRAGLS